MNLKDQASKLREMMNVIPQRQQGVCAPVAVLTCGEKGRKDYSFMIAEKISQKQGKNVLMVNTQTKDEDIKTLMDKPYLFDNVKQELTLTLNEIQDNFDTIYEMIKNKKIKDSYIRLLEKIEGYKEVLVYHCGNSINAKNMNLMALSSSIVLVIDGTRESIETALHVLKIQSKIQNHTDYFIIGNNIDSDDLEMVVEYLKKESSVTIHDNIKGIAAVSLEKVKAGDYLEMAKWGAVSIPLKEHTKSLSERLKVIV